MSRLCMLTVVALSLAFAPAPFPRPKKPESASARIVRAMESYRTKMPPAEGLGEQNGLTVKELEPYLMSHLAGVRRLDGEDKGRVRCPAALRQGSRLQDPLHRHPGRPRGHEGVPERYLGRIDSRHQFGGASQDGGAIRGTDRQDEALMEQHPFICTDLAG